MERLYVSLLVAVLWLAGVSILFTLAGVDFAENSDAAHVVFYSALVVAWAFAVGMPERDE